MTSNTENVKMIIAPVNETNSNSVEMKIDSNSVETKIDSNSVETKIDSNSVEMKINSNKNRKSTRQRKKRNFFINEKFESNKRSCKRKRSIDINTEKESDQEIPVPPTDNEIREMHSQKLAKVFQEYIFKILDDLQLPLEREKTRINDLVKNLNNAISLKEKVFVSKNMGYLVSSLDRKLTYNVNLKEFANNLKYVCNCGENFKDSDRTSCKHCGSVIFHNLENYLLEYLSKPYQPNVHLQLHHVNNMFNKFGIEKNENNLLKKSLELTSSDKEKVVSEKDNYFSFLMNIDTPIL